jgi:acyl-CoA thioester hydrolase
MAPLETYRLLGVASLASATASFQLTQVGHARSAGNDRPPSTLRGQPLPQTRGCLRFRNLHTPRRRSLLSHPATHRVPLQVRDYECDAGGGVNNAVYLNYFEHARFQFMREHLGWDVERLTRHKIGFVLVNLNIDFRRSLMPGQRFTVESTMTRTAIRRFLFAQEIHVAGSPEQTEARARKPAVSARVLCTAINTETGRSETPPLLEALLSDFPVIASETV